MSIGSRTPLLKKKLRSHHLAQTGWCRPGFLDQHHPVRSSKEASRSFLSVASTPPRLRRGVSSHHIFVIRR